MRHNEPDIKPSQAESPFATIDEDGIEIIVEERTINDVSVLRTSEGIKIEAMGHDRFFVPVTGQILTRAEAD